MEGTSREQSVEEVEHSESTTSSVGRAAEEQAPRSDEASPAPVVPVKRATDIRRRRLEVERKQLETEATRRELELKRQEFEAEMARKELALEIRELQLEEELQGVGDYAEEAWSRRSTGAAATRYQEGMKNAEEGLLNLTSVTTPVYPLKMPPKRERDNKMMAGASAMAVGHQPFTPPVTSSPPTYDRTFAFDQAAAQEREYAEWRRAVEDSIVTHRESHAKCFNDKKPSPATGFLPTTLTPSQRAAREVTSKELPVFSGAIEQWPIFIANYDRSTAACGFTEEENLLRLQKALRGPALDSVDHLLYFPTGLSEAMAILKSEYGRPDLIVDSLIDKVRRLPAPRADRLETIAAFAKAVRKMCGTIRISGLQDYDCNVTLLQELSAKLPPERRLEWSRHKVTLKRITIGEFGKWIGEIGEAASREVNPFTRSAPPERHHHAVMNRQSQPARNTYVSVHTTTERKCTLCEGACRSLGECSTFRELAVSRRRAHVRQLGLCRQCLGRHKRPCVVRGVCDTNGCQVRHHKLLHEDATQPSTEGTSPSLTTANTVCNKHTRTNTNTLLRYVPVIVRGNGKEVATFAFLDEGSSSTFVDRSLIEELGVTGEPHPLCLRWTGNTTREEVDSVCVSLRISGTHIGAATFELPKVHSVQDLSLPAQSLPLQQLVRQYAYLQKLPIEPYAAAKPRLLIGADNCRLGKPQRCAEGKTDEPIAAKTRLGWTVFGPCCLASTVSTAHDCFHICVCNERSDDNLDAGLREYFSLESLGVSSPRKLISKDEERAVSLLASETRLLNNRYETCLLWKYDEVRLPCNREMAQGRHRCLMKKMKRNPTLAKAICQKINEYEDNGYIRRMNPCELAERGPRDWFLPIFPVFNPNKPGKLRMVFDAAAQVCGVSLNSFLLTGPDQLASLTGVLYKFREFHVAITADIREMFFQVRMKLEDQRSQMFLWDDASDPDGEPNVYAVSVMTFGAACSPGSAQHVKNINAERFSKEYPRAAHCIKYEHYVDDMLASVETVEEAVTLAEDVRFIHAQGGFEIRNWLSNSKEVVDRLRWGVSTDVCVSMSSEQATEKVLGMWWNTLEDTFTFRLNPRHDGQLLAGTRVPTKREVLRTLMMIYDPLGLVGNFLMFLKILLQDVWRTGKRWDDRLDGEAAKKWSTWIAVLPSIQNVSVQRCYRSLTTTAFHDVQLHIFCDASQSCMAAVAYFRFQEGDVIECALVGSKTRVAPLKFLSIPRLELQAAILGKRLAEHIVDSHRMKITKRTFWTDSRNVVSWIKADHHRYSPFVAFRVSEIVDSTSTNDWRWLSTKVNVADEGTKWQKTPDMTPTSRWFRGPDFLRQTEDKWPINRADPGETTEEIRHNLLHHDEVNTIVNFSRFSRWRTLLKVFGYIHRYVGNLRRSAKQEALEGGPLTQEELSAAERSLFVIIQLESFGRDIKLLKDDSAKQHPWKGAIRKNSVLYKLSPGIDECGVLRMKGRLNNCPPIETSLCKPVILPRRHPATDLIIRDFHERYCHSSHRTVVNQLRLRYHIPKLLVEFNRVRRTCQCCKNRSATPNPPLMGNIPRERLAVAQRAFTHTGLDYFGPIVVAVGRRTEKRWGAIFTCLTTRAVHLEVAHSMTTASCILAIRRFIARRGSPREIISDRGTNFVGAARELREALKEVDGGALMTRFSSPELKWQFNPPAAPHFGGCWERLVQSVKKILNSLALPRLPTDEILFSTLTEIEMILNSRPLTYVPLDDELDLPITPNHLLLGSSDGRKTPAMFDQSPTAVRSMWSVTQQNAEIFWKRWTADYLPTLTRRTRWFQPMRPIKEGDVVIVVDSNLPRNTWPMGRVLAVTRAGDGQVRRATVQTINGLLERPATKIAVLDVRAPVEGSEAAET